jgi:molybdopterin converting factor subunit 1
LKNWSNGLADGEIKCKVLFFAAAAQAMDCREQEITVQQYATAGDVLELLAENCEPFAALSSTCALAVDRQLSKRDTQLCDGCTIAILPPVSGG